MVHILKRHNTNIDIQNNLNCINFWRILKVNPETHKQQLW